MADSIQDRLKKVPPFDDEQIEQDDKQAEDEKTEGDEDPGVEDKPVEEVSDDEVNEEEALENSKNPERTKEYIDKIKKEKAELENVIDSLKPKAPPVMPSVPNIPELAPEVMEKAEKVAQDMTSEQVDDIYANLIDENGYIDPKLLIETLKNANEEAKKAMAAAENAKIEAQSAKVESERKIRDFEESREVRRVHRKYPQIDPKSESFNELFWDDVRKEIATAPFLKGETVSFMEAADKIWKERYAEKEEVSQVNKKEKKEMEALDNAKRNINATSMSKGTRRSDDYAPADEKALTEAIRLGKRGALAEKLKRLGQ